MPLLRHDKITRKMQKVPAKIWKNAAASSQIPYDLCEATLVFDWLVVHSSMAWMKMTPKGQWGRAWQVRTWAKVHTTPAEPSALAELPSPTEPGAPATAEAPNPRRSGVKEEGGKETGAGGEVSRVIPNQTIGWDCHQSEAIDISWGGANPEETPANHGRQGPRKKFLKAGQLKKPQRYWLRIVALQEVCQFQKSTELLIHKLPFSCLVHKIAQEVGLCRKLQSIIWLASWKMPTYVLSMQNTSWSCPKTCS